MVEALVPLQTYLHGHFLLSISASRIAVKIIIA
jgi:hypothetical protein